MELLFGGAAVVLKSLVAFSTKFLYTVNGRFLVSVHVGLCSCCERCEQSQFLKNDY